MNADDTELEASTSEPVTPIEVFPPMSKGELLNLRDASRMLRMDRPRARALFAPGGALHHCLWDPFGQWPNVVRISARRLTQALAEGHQ